MTEAAALGVSVDADGLIKGARALDEFSASADKADKASDRISASAGKASSAVKSMGGATAQTAKEIARVAAMTAQERAAYDAAARSAWEKEMAVRKAAVADQQAAGRAFAAAQAQKAQEDAARRSAAAMQAAAQAQAGAAAPAQQYSREVERLKAMIEPTWGALQKYKAQIDLLRTAMAQGAITQEQYIAQVRLAKAEFQQLGAVAAQSAGAMKANTGNIAAQFQDIGVTAAMGMNPMLIALQQGTQLSSVLADGGIKNLAGAFKSLISPVSLATIAVVAGAAALIQWGTAALKGDDAAKKASESIKDLDRQFNFATISAKQLKEVNELLAEANSKIERTSLGAATATRQMAAANRDAAQSALMAAKAEYERIAAFSSDPTFAEGNLAYSGQMAALTEKIKNTEKAMAGFAKQERLAAFDMASLTAGMDDSARKAEVLRTRINQLREAYGDTKDAKEQAVIMREMAIAQERLANIKPAQRASDKAAREAATAARKEQREAERDAEKYAETVAKFNKESEQQLRSLEQAATRIGVYGTALSRLTNEQDAFNRAQDNGIKVSAEMAKKVRENAAAMAELQTANANRQFMADFAREVEIATFSLERQRGELFLTGSALDAYRQSTEKQIAAMREGVELRAQDIAKINDQAKAMADAKAKADEMKASWESVIASSNQAVQASLEASIEAVKKQMMEAREVVGGFFSDWEKGMRRGGSVVKTFADSAINALNRIADKIMDRAISGFLDSIFGAVTGGGSGGFLGSLLGGAKPNAKGGVYGAPEPFRKGGAFTNQIVASPTLFRFAKGGALGEMGEAGPEAIMPLKRGPDGSLGVQSHGVQRIELVVRGEPGPLFVPTIEEISGNQAVRVTQAGLQSYDDQLPTRFQQIAGDERLR